jgi:hypothetical protein
MVYCVRAVVPFHQANWRERAGAQLTEAGYSRSQARVRGKTLSPQPSSVTQAAQISPRSVAAAQMWVVAEQ